MSVPPCTTIVLIKACAQQGGPDQEVHVQRQLAQEPISSRPAVSHRFAPLGLGLLFSTAPCILCASLLGKRAGADIFADQPALDPSGARIVRAMPEAGLPAHCVTPMSLRHLYALRDRVYQDPATDANRAGGLESSP
jgi:hypothetical protein